MVIIRTSATEVSIQAVSPELGVHFSRTAFFGSGSLAQAGGGAGGVAGAAAGAAAGACACAYATSCATLRKRHIRIPNARAKSPARDDFINVMVLLLSVLFAVRVLARRGIGLAGADAHGVFQIEDEDFSVADLTGFRGAGDSADDFVDLLGVYRHFDLDFRQEAHRILGPTIDFRVPLLTPVTFDFGNCEPLHADGGQSVTDLVQLEGFNNGHDDLHGFDPRLSPFVYVRSAGGSLSPCPRRSLRRHGRRDRIKRRARCRRRSYLIDLPPRTRRSSGRLIFGRRLALKVAPKARGAA